MFNHVKAVRHTVILMLVLMTGLLCACGKGRVRELEEYHLSMSRFFENIAAYDQAINAIDPASETASDELLRNLDGLNTEFQAMAACPIPDEFASITEITADAAASMDRAVTLYHEAYADIFDQAKADEARMYYQRAGRCLQIIVQVLHGETPSGEGVTVTY